VTLRNVAVGGVKFGELERQLVDQILKSERLTYGPLTQQFEREFAAIHERRFAVFMNSGTSALQVGLDALRLAGGWSRDDEILVPALTFVASSNVVLQNGLRPVFVDIDPLYYELDPTLLSERITPRTKAIMPVHLFGQPCDMDPIMDLARTHALAVIEDSCETMFARYKGKPTGSWGEVSCFSTYVAHLLVTGVGGFATTNDPSLAIRIKSLSNHGRDAIYLSIDDDDHASGRDLFRIVDRRFKFVDVGYSYRATEFEAAIGIAQLRRWQEAIDQRRRNAHLLDDVLSRYVDFLRLPNVRPNTEHAFMMYPIVVRPPVERDQLVHHLESNGIETRPMLPLLSQPIYQRLFGDLRPDYPVATEVEQRGFYIGCHPLITEEDIVYVGEIFSRFFD
jgi:dTDP-4-amino-4,6-dideoxygalactose transaminase